MSEVDISKQEEDFDEEDFYKLERKRLEEILEKIRCGESTTENYFEVFTSYKILQNEEEYESEIKKYADLILQAAKSDSDQEKANVCVAYVYEYYNDKEQALFHINKALSLNPKNAELYMVRAGIYENFKMKKEADADYAKASALSPGLAETINSIKSSGKLSKKTLFLIIFPIIIYVIFIIFLFL